MMKKANPKRNQRNKKDPKITKTLNKTNKASPKIKN